MTALHIGVAACFLAPDERRDVFRGKRLGYFEEQTIHYVQSRGDFAWLLPTRPNGGRSVGDYAEWVDGLVLQGGSDIAPQSYREEPLHSAGIGDAYRDHYELQLIEAFRARGKPIFGICRGLQMINVALGGSLYQDLATQVPDGQVHRDVEKYDRLFHEVEIARNSGLDELYAGSAARTVNSIHHQAIREPGQGLVVEAWAVPDRTIEAMRYVGEDWIFGVQWHPEFLDRRDRALLDPFPLLDDFRGACLQRRKSPPAAARTA